MTDPTLLLMLRSLDILELFLTDLEGGCLFLGGQSSEFVRILELNIYTPLDSIPVNTKAGQKSKFAQRFLGSI